MQNTFTVGMNKAKEWTLRPMRTGTVLGTEIPEGTEGKKYKIT